MRRHFKSPDFLEVDNYTDVNFESTKVEADAGALHDDRRPDRPRVTRRNVLALTIRGDAKGLLIRTRSSLRAGEKVRPARLRACAAIALVISDILVPNEIKIAVGLETAEQMLDRSESAARLR